MRSDTRALNSLMDLPLVGFTGLAARTDKGRGGCCGPGPLCLAVAGHQSDRFAWRLCVCLRFATVILVLVIAASSALADERPALEDGSRIRITLIEPRFGSVLEPKRIEGRLLSLTTTDITLARSEGEQPKVIRSENIEKVELCTQQGRRLKGALIGAGIGAASGFLYGMVFVGDTSDDPDDWGGGTAAEAGAVWAVLMAPAGAIIGALVAPGERWQLVQSEQVQLGIYRSEIGQGGVLVTMRF